MIPLPLSPVSTPRSQNKPLIRTTHDTPAHRLCEDPPTPAAPWLKWTRFFLFSWLRVFDKEHTHRLARRCSVRQHQARRSKGTNPPIFARWAHASQNFSLSLRPLMLLLLQQLLCSPSARSHHSVVGKSFHPSTVRFFARTALPPPPLCPRPHPPLPDSHRNPNTNNTMERFKISRPFQCLALSSILFAGLS